MISSVVNSVGTGSSVVRSAVTGTKTTGSVTRSIRNGSNGSSVVCLKKFHRLKFKKILEITIVGVVVLESRL